MNAKVYERDVDAGHGFQRLVFVGGKCIDQDLHSKTNGWYTGDGNPEFIGQTPRQIGMKANGFKRWSNREDERELAHATLALIAENERVEAEGYANMPS